MATQSELAQIQHILGKRRNLDQNPLDLSARKKSREYLDSHKDVEKRRRDRINTCLDTIRTLVPLCHQLPRHRRVDKADLLDLAIIYLRMVNQFLEKIGVSDIFSAAHQQVSLFSSLEKYVKEQGEKHTGVTEFSKEILEFLEREMETASHVIASQETSGITIQRPESSLQQTSEWLKNEDDSSTTRSCLSSSGSDEEKSVNYHADREDRSSSSDDSPLIDSPANRIAQTYYKKCTHSYKVKEHEGVLASHEVDCKGSARRSLPNDCYSSYHMQNCQKNLPCVDKAVNTDSSPTDFTLHPDRTFTLPIMSGQIILQAPMGTPGSYNPNNPVALRAEIHATSIQQQPHPCQSCVSCPGSYHGETPFLRQAPQKNPSVEPSCLSTCSVKHKSCNNSQFPHATHFTGAFPYASSLYSSSPYDVKIPFPQSHPDKLCSQDTDRQNPSCYHDEAYCSDEQETKSYASLMPLKQTSKEKEYSAPQSPQPLVSQRRNSDSCFNSSKNGPFSKRYLAGISQLQESNNNDEHTRNTSKTCSCCPKTSSSMKLKSLMVHRHHSQHAELK